MRDILKITLDLCLSTISIGGLFVPFFLGINSFSGDFEQRTIYTVLARPVSRAVYIFGKFAGLGLLTATVIGLLSCFTLLAVWVFSFIYPEHFLAGLSLPSIVVCCMMILMSILMLNSTVVLWCSVTTSSFLATLLTLATYIIGQTVEDILHFLSIQVYEVTVSPVVYKTIQAALYIFPNLSAFDFKQQAAHGLAINHQEIFLLSVYSISYATAVLVVAVIIFNKRDLS